MNASRLHANLIILPFCFISIYIGADFEVVFGLLCGWLILVFTVPVRLCVLFELAGM